MVILVYQRVSPIDKPIERFPNFQGVSDWAGKLTYPPSPRRSVPTQVMVKFLTNGWRITHRIHGAGIYANIGGILMVNVTIYSIHGSYGLYRIIQFHKIEIIRKFMLKLLNHVPIWRFPRMELPPKPLVLILK